MTETKGIKLKAVLLGVLTDIGGSLAFGLVLGIIAGIVLASQGVPQNEFAERFQRLGVMVPSLIIGLGFTVLGGYVAGRVAKQSEILHGGMVGLVSILFGLLFMGPVPLWYDFVGVVCSVPSGMAGGYLVKKGTTGKELPSQNL